MLYSKPFKSFSEQADRLINRGLVADKSDLVNALEKIGYYRLTGYLVPYKNQDETYRGNIELNTVLRLYDFDNNLRLLIFDGVQKIEVSIRTQLTYALSESTGAFGYTRRSGLPRLSEKKFQSFIDSCKSSYKISKETFISHFKEKYGDNCDLPPYWMLANIMDFGQLCTLYSGAAVDIRQLVAAKYGVTSKVMDSWLRSIRLIRNVCAHHSRLWNKALGFAPRCPKDISSFKTWNYKAPQKLYNNLVVIRYLLLKIEKDDEFSDKFNSFMHDYKDVPAYQMGFPYGQRFLA